MPVGHDRFPPSLVARDPDRWADIMRSTIAINASFFNTQQMLGQYVVLAYRAAPPPA